MVDPEQPFTDFQALFGELFAGASVQEHGADLHVGLTVPLAEALEGTERVVTVPRRDICAHCDGSGAEAGTERTRCPDCEGAGRVASVNGAFQMETSCGRCAGAGSYAESPCPPCEGSGGEVTEVELTVQIPGGVTEGLQLRLGGAGNRAAGGSGDVYVGVSIERDARFRRDGADVHVTVPLSPADFVVGGVFDVPHWIEECAIELDPGAEPGDERVLEGWGGVRLGQRRVPIPTSDEPYRSVDTSAHRGDLIVRFVLPSTEPDVAPWAPQTARAERADGRGFLMLFAFGAVGLAVLAWWLTS